LTLTCIILDLDARRVVSATSYDVAPAAAFDPVLMHKLGVSIARLAAPDVANARIAWAQGRLSLEDAVAGVTADVFDKVAFVEEWILDGGASVMRVDFPGRGWN